MKDIDQLCKTESFMIPWEKTVIVHLFLSCEKALSNYFVDVPLTGIGTKAVQDFFFDFQIYLPISYIIGIYILHILADYWYFYSLCETFRYGNFRNCRNMADFEIAYHLAWNSNGNEVSAFLHALCNTICVNENLCFWVFSSRAWRKNSNISKNFATITFLLICTCSIEC